jgi:hypothetical protein
LRAQTGPFVARLGANSRQHKAQKIRIFPLAGAEPPPVLRAQK